MSDEQLNTEQNIEAAVIETDPMSKMNCAFCGAEINIEGLPRFSSVACTACAKENTVSAKLGHFVLLKSLGSGGMGTVFLAEDENLGRKVAIKVMQKQLGQDPALFETFRNEAQSAARLNHPHVAQIYSFGREKGLPYLAMELVNGNKLDEMIESGTALDPAFVLRVGLEIAEGLKAAEEVGLFHGDIKPDNILFDENMQAKLVDFGIASMASQGATNELWGTPYYIAPEKVQKKKNSARSDIYSLGATLYHAIAGQPPYEGADAVAVIKARFAGPPPALESIRPDIEPEVTRIIGRMMYNDLFMRYPNYGSLINDIKAYLANIPEARKAGPGKRPTIRTAAATATNSINLDTTASSPSPSHKSGKKFVITKGAMSSSAVHSAPPPANINLVANNGGSPNNQNLDELDNPGIEKKKRNKNNVKIIFISAIVFFVLLILVVAGVFIKLILDSGEQEAKSEQLKNDIAQIESKFEPLTKEINQKLTELQQRSAKIEPFLKEVEQIYADAADITPIFPDFEPPQESVSEETTEASLTVVAAEYTEEQLAEAKKGLIDLGIAEPNEDQVKNMAAKLFATPAANDANPANPLKGKTIETITAKLIADNPELAKVVGEKILTDGMKRKARTAILDSKTANDSDSEDPTEEEIIKRAITIIGKDINAKLAELDDADKEAITAAINAAAGAAETISEETTVAQEETPQEDEVPAVDNEEEKARKELDDKANQHVYECIKELKAIIHNAEKLANDAINSQNQLQPLNEKNSNLNLLTKTHEEYQKTYDNLADKSTKLTDAIANADKVVRKIENGIKRFKMAVEPLKNQKTRLAKEAAAAKAAAEEETRRVVEEAKRQNKIKEEIEKINSSLDEKKKIIDKFEYEKVIKQMSAMEQELEFEESKEALGYVIKRFERLIELKAFMLDDIDKFSGLRNGYRRYDITGISADRKTLHVRPSKDIPVSSLVWKDWKTLFYYQIYKREKGRPISYNEEAEQLFNSAIMLYVHGFGDAASEQLMRECLTRAFKKKETLSIDAIRFIPILTQEEIDKMKNGEQENLDSSDAF